MFRLQLAADDLHAVVPKVLAVLRLGEISIAGLTLVPDGDDGHATVRVFVREKGDRLDKLVSRLGQIVGVANLTVTPEISLACHDRPNGRSTSSGAGAWA